MSVSKDFFDDMDLAFDKKAEQDKQEREAGNWEPKEGEALRGIFQKVRFIDTQFGVKPLAFFRDVESGDTVKVWLSSSVLQTIVDFEPKPGTPVGIRYEGWQKPVSDRGNEYKSYTIVLPETRTEDEMRAGFQHWQKARQDRVDGPTHDDRDEIVATTADDFKPF